MSAVLVSHVVVLGYSSERIRNPMVQNIFLILPLSSVFANSQYSKPRFKLPTVTAVTVISTTLRLPVAAWENCNGTE